MIYYYMYYTDLTYFRLSKALSPSHIDEQAKQNLKCILILNLNLLPKYISNKKFFILKETCKISYFVCRVASSRRQRLMTYFRRSDVVKFLSSCMVRK